MFYPQVLFALPLIILFSLVYAGTRHELPDQILKHALRFALVTLGLMIGIGVVLEILTYWKG